MKRLMFLSLVFVFSSSVAIAATEDTGTWDNVKRLRVGDKIEVIDQSLKSFRGTLVSVTEDVISLQSKKDTFTVERTNVLRVSVRDSAKRTRNMLIGAAIGAGAGLAIGLAANAPMANEGNNSPGLIAGLTAGAAGAGLGLGAATGNRTVYRAPKTAASGSFEGRRQP